jgi:hypothetical protein
MADWERYGERFVSILRQWNQAEEDIKLAEQINHKVAWPSIKELRYAGRRLIEALAEIHRGGSSEKIVGLLQDAEFDCLRARHDAIDVATAKIALDFEAAASRLGHEAILAAFEGFPRLSRNLVAVREKIANSRKNREDREKIYEAIEGSDFKNIVDQYRQFNSSERMMRIFARKDRHRRFFGYAIGLGGLIVGIIGVVVAII